MTSWGAGGRSDDLSLWNVERFVEELAAILKKLGIREYHLLGQSWGATLALEHALREPKGLKSLILASPFLSASAWINDMNFHRENLPSEQREILAKHERAGTLDCAEAVRATEFFYGRHVYRTTLQHSDYQESARGMAYSVYSTMWGPTEFVINGVLKDYDQTGRLKELKVPVLFTCGRWDEARPETVERFKSLVPGAQMRVFENSAHMAHLEEADAYMETMRRFLGEVLP